MLETKTAVGIYTDAALSGVDVCLLTTDGLDLYGEPLSISRGYDPSLKEELSSLKTEADLANSHKLITLEEKITTHIIEVVKELLELGKRTFPQINIIGLSGQNVYHNANNKISISLANADKIAQTFNVPVVNRFIQSDLAAGGKGGPLLASFYEVLTKNMPKPLVIASLGGLSALTYIGDIGQMRSFHVGPGNILLDMWIQKRYGQEMDYDGLFGAKGTVDERLLNVLMKHPFLAQEPPKTADRNEFNDLLKQVDGSHAEDGAATLTAFIGRSLTEALRFLPEKPELWILTGGGTFNPTLVLDIKKRLSDTRVETATEFGWDKNTLSAWGYGFLAVRSLFGLPISYPATTGVSEPISGGLMHIPKE
ncbi:MAG: anhydro-N-acetylmuramic acid kinase [Alphaproteobacteria bacterium]|nr:anhydro-N-acetylmuramic acid kinase [Alphaproteobacteria bacterium]